jgi:hypothetical protein
MGTFPGFHAPSRPAWVCSWCSAPFPCPGGRDQLVAEYGYTVALGRELYGLLEDAVRELPEPTVTELWDRFCAWAEPAPTVVAHTGSGWFS